MAELVKRVGPPKATDLKGEEFTWTIQLSAAPSREWSRNPRCSVIRGAWA